MRTLRPKHPMMEPELEHRKPATMVELVRKDSLETEKLVRAAPERWVKLQTIHRFYDNMNIERKRSLTMEKKGRERMNEEKVMHTSRS